MLRGLEIHRFSINGGSHVFQAFGYCRGRYSDDGGHCLGSKQHSQKDTRPHDAKPPRRGIPVRELPNMRLVTSSATNRNQHLSLRRVTELPRPPLVCARVKDLYQSIKRRDHGAWRARVLVAGRAEGFQEPIRRIQRHHPRDGSRPREPGGTDELSFKIVKMLGAKDEVIARAENLLICRGVR